VLVPAILVVYLNSYYENSLNLKASYSRYGRVEGMIEKLYICYKCLMVQSKNEMRKPGKVKGLSLESSRNIKMCKSCSCKVFLT